ncbi:protein LRATD1 isoform X2 [Trachemys scripta elegans]|uniref:protein LRATD1 isoform X2 n=1 Tax=Trachemys scripta elegans TaxID=31138 RepID=UPI001555C4F0|nr:protein LRATD1 isoform X2 [Trachemys scripta elegans]
MSSARGGCRAREPPVLRLAGAGGSPERSGAVQGKAERVQRAGAGARGGAGGAGDDAAHLLCGSHGDKKSLRELGAWLERGDHGELPTGDPSGIEKDELRVGVAYFFSDEEEDLDERGQQDKYSVKGSSSPGQETPTHHHQLVLNETQFSAFRGQECIFSKVSSGPQAGDLRVFSVSALPALSKPGDLLELLYLGPSDHPPPPPHWAVYVGSGQIIHLHQGQIRQDSLYEAGAGNVGRVVNSWYRYRPLVAELVVQNACGHLGLKSDEICWTNSESFAAWCRFGKREFKAGGELQAAAGTQHQQQYYLKIHLAENKVHTVRFHSLEDLIREKRRIDASGKLRVIKDLAIVDGKE